MLNMQQERVHIRPHFFYGYWILLVGFLCQVVMNGCAGYAFSLYVVPLSNEFGWNRSTIMGGNLILTLMMGFFPLFVERVIYRWGAKWVISAGALLMGIGFISLSLTQALWQFYILYAIVGLGSAATGVVPTSMVICNWFKRRRGFAIGILGTGIGVGGFVMPMFLGAYIIPQFGWRMSYIASGIISAVVIIPFSLWFIKSRPEEMGLFPDNCKIPEDKQLGTLDGAEPKFKLDTVLKTSVFWLMAIGFISFGIANGNTFQTQVPHLQDVGFSAVVAASAMGFVGISSAIAKFGFGWLCDLIPPKYILVIGSALQAAATLILMSLTPGSLSFMLWLYAALFGLGVGCWFPAISMTTSVTFGLIAYGTIFSIYNMLFMVSCAVSPLVGGYIFDTTGSYNLAFLLCLFFYVVAILSMLLVRRPKPEKE